ASNTLFSFSIPKNDYVRFSVFSTNGNEISVLINENKKAGEFSADLNKAKLTKGTYYYRLVVGNYKEIRRLNIIK
ncbi:MAG: T9SS type A sorting domain-containing protein, partial [Ignavibacteria bacterium]|nr:T9SS type A sorting domain-containing protein [Ignavibacteria bacterium]